MAIRLNGGTPQKTNNFITFFNSDSPAIGAIEGQTATDAFATLKAAYLKKGISIASKPGLNKLLTDATYQAEVIRKSQATYRASYQAILEKSKQ